MTELLEIAILAYRNGRYRDAIEMLMQVTDADANCWLARLYLGMAYQKTGRIADAQRAFKRVANECTEDHIRIKAENALPLVEAELRRRFKKETPVSTPSKNDAADIVWVAN